jgi:amidase
VPVNLSPAGLPVAVQLVGRPDDEGTILSLAAQLEAARPWAERRPPVS